ncbi:ASCH domain-containing protein [Desulfosediminicola sp.]|uniref:ASCH domain-containing protein n=1 Tax=Desulfosediminicola sp. TaxID=2886825 RepID=UPI003AF27504
MDKAANKNVIMISIHPQFAKAIFRGEKTVEFRKFNIPRHVEFVVLYVTAPESKIVGYFKVKDVIEDDAPALWRRFKDVSGTTKEFFFKYYGEQGKGRCFLVDDVNVLQNPISLDNFNGGKGRPPQSFSYVDKAAWGNLKRRKKKLSPIS